jgi:hypothetical protein
MDDANKKTPETTYNPNTKKWEKRDVIKDYVDPADSKIGKGASDAAPGMQDTELDAGAPKREDFPEGIVGQGKFNKATIEYREKKRSSPMRQAVRNLMKPSPSPSPSPLAEPPK